MKSGPDLATVERLDDDERTLLHLHRRQDMSAKQRDVLLRAAMKMGWDDAIHIAAPWEPRASLCGNWNRNRVSLDEERPEGLRLRLLFVDPVRRHEARPAPLHERPRIERGET